MGDKDTKHQKSLNKPNTEDARKDDVIKPGTVFTQQRVKQADGTYVTRNIKIVPRAITFGNGKMWI